MLCGVWTHSCPGRVATTGIGAWGCASRTSPAQHALGGGVMSLASWTVAPLPPEASTPACWFAQLEVTLIPASRQPALLVSYGWWRPWSRAWERSAVDSVSPWPCSFQTPAVGEGACDSGGGVGTSPLPGKDGVQAVLKPLVPGPRQEPARGPRVQTVLEMACKVVAILAVSLN